MIVSAQLLEFPKKFERKSRPTAAMKLGLVYEADVNAELTMLLEDWVYQPNFQFTRKGSCCSFIIPDVIAWNGNRDVLTIIEIKLRHSYDGYNQLQRYLPVVQKVYPGAKINLLEICKTYEPTTRIPNKSIVEDVRTWVDNHHPELYGIHQWSPK